MTIKELVKVCHQIAVEKGFWGDTGITKKTRNTYVAFPTQRNDGEMLMLIVSELGEALEALRHNDQNHFAEEIADTFIRLFDMCGGKNIDIEKVILEKIEKNKTRPYKHNKGF
jgi:NTP pyrophosphatase (non-canonical NTP hydrolase)